MNCSVCGYPMIPDDIICRYCGHYLRLAEVEKMMADAVAMEKRHEYRHAQEIWQRVLQLLPAESRHRVVITGRLHKLQHLLGRPESSQPPAARPAAHVSAPRPAQRGPRRSALRLLMKTACIVFGIIAVGAAAWAGRTWGPELVDLVLDRLAPGDTASQLEPVAAAFRNYNWEQAREKINTLDDNRARAEAQLLYDFLTEDENLWGALYHETAPDKISQLLELKKEPVWRYQWDSIDSGIIQVLTTRLAEMQNTEIKLRFALAVDAPNDWREHWNVLSAGDAYFTALNLEAYPRPRGMAFVKKARLLADESAPAVVHAYLAPLEKMANGPWNGDRAMAALDSIERALTILDKEQWLQSDLANARRAAAGIAAGWETPTDNPQAKEALERFVSQQTTVSYAEVAANRVARGARVYWHCKLIKCENAILNMYRYGQGDATISGNWRMEVEHVSPETDSRQTALVLFNGNIPGSLSSASRLRVAGTVAGRVSWADEHGLADEIPLINGRFLIGVDGMIVSAGTVGNGSLGARAQRLAVHLQQ